MSTRPEYYYVHPAIEMAGVELDYFELNGMDTTGMQGYADLFPLASTGEFWNMPEPPLLMNAPAQERAMRVPRIEPSTTPNWIEPPERFQ